MIQIIIHLSFGGIFIIKVATTTCGRLINTNFPLPVRFFLDYTTTIMDFCFHGELHKILRCTYTR